MRLDVEVAATEEPDRIALVTDDGEESFRDLAAAVRARTVELRAALGATTLQGASVAAVGGTDRESVVNVLAALHERATLTLIHAGIPHARRREQLEAVGASLLVDGNRIDRLDGPPTAAHAWAALVFTSGSTGTPRGVPLSRANLLAAADASAANLGWRDDDRWWLGLPLAHVGGLSIVTRCLVGRRAVVVSGAPAADAFLRHRVTLASLVPTQLRRLLAAWADRTPDTALRACLVGGAATPSPLVREARTRGIPVLLTWGMSEAASQLATQSPDRAFSLDPADLRTVGRPLPGVELRVREARACVRGPMVTTGYLPASSPPNPDVDGWFDTGDLVEWDGTGLKVLGRGNDLVISGGENVSPAFVEGCLCEHPSVAAAAVVGVADEEWGHAVAAAVVWRHEPDDAALLAWCRETLAPWERPRALRGVAELPVGPTGKIDREAVRALFA